MKVPRWKRWATAYWACAISHELASALGMDRLRMFTKTALMPTLAYGAHTHDCPPLLVAALLLSAVGDVLMEQNALLPGMAMFAAAHACYIALFTRGRDQARWQVLAAYAVLGAVTIAALWSGLGALRIPVLVYASMLTATAVTSRWYDRRTGLGGALFVISDSLIGVQLAGHDFPGRDRLVGLTYAAGQYRLTTGVLAHR
jgi:uncharacterized membrane protein YhhN